MVNEKEYILIQNRVSISMSLCSLREVLTGDDYGISDNELKSITIKLAELQTRLFSLIETVEEVENDT